MKVLVSDNLGEIGVQMLRDEEGIEVDVKTGLHPEELKEIIGEYDGLIIRSATSVTAELIAEAKNLKVVGRAGIGLDNVDIEAATNRGIAVMNTPGGNTVTTAEHAIGMLMSLTRNIPQATSSLKENLWEKKALQGREIFNKTLGVIGFGNIGSIAADRARGLKMKVIVYDPYITPEHIEKAGFQPATLDEIYEKSDYITVHVPRVKATTHLLNKEAFAKMKDGVMVINCARGGIVEENDLYDALTSGKVAGAALDVFEVEPPKDNPLLTLKNVIATPHLGASTREAQTNVAVAVADQVIKYLKYDTTINAVNVPSVTGELLVKLAPFLNIADRTGCLLAQLTKDPITGVTIEYTGDFSGLDLMPVTTSVLKGLLTPLVMETVNFVNAPAIAKKMGIKVTETLNAESENYTNLITVRVDTVKGSNTAAGTLFGKKDARVVRINTFRLEVIPKGHLALIHNVNEPGAIGGIGSTLGKHKINIARMMVGQEDEGDRNIIFLRTDTPISDEVVKELDSLPLVHSAITLEL